jgi:hypothetical protein
MITMQEHNDWWALVKSMLNLCIPNNVENFLTGWICFLILYLFLSPVPWWGFTLQAPFSFRAPLVVLLPPFSFPCRSHLALLAWLLHGTVSTSQSQFNYSLCNYLPNCSQHSSWTDWHLKTGVIGCPKMSLSNYQSILCNIQNNKDHTWKTVFSSDHPLG